MDEMGLKVFHSVNCGLYFYGSTGLLVDGIFEGNGRGVSPMPEEIWSLFLEAGCGCLEGVIFTHLHEDHFSRFYLEQVQKRVPGLRVYGPGLTDGNISVQKESPGIKKFRMGDAWIWAVDTCHDGKDYGEVAHCSYFIQMDRYTVFVSGDACGLDELCPSAGQELPDKVDMAFVNIYQALSQDTYRFLRQMKVEQVYLYHLPFQRDDSCNLWRIASQAMRKFPGDLPPLRILKHMNWQ